MVHVPGPVLDSVWEGGETNIPVEDQDLAASLAEVVLADSRSYTNIVEQAETHR